MGDQYINVKILKVYGTCVGSDHDIVITIGLEEGTGDKYLEVLVMTRESEVFVFKYPDVNEQINSIMDIIDLKGGSEFDPDEYGVLVGPSLTKPYNDKFYIARLNDVNNTVFQRDAVVTKNTKLYNFKCYGEIIRDFYDKTPHDDRVKINLYKRYQTSFKSNKIGDKFIDISVGIEKETGDKYISVNEISPNEYETKTYKYPNVNKQLNSIMDFIEQKCKEKSKFEVMTGSDLISIDSFFEEFAHAGMYLRREYIVTENTKLDDHKFYRKMLKIK
jgi:hypothetical protein